VCNTGGFADLVLQAQFALLNDVPSIVVVAVVRHNATIRTSKYARETANALVRVVVNYAVNNRQRAANTRFNALRVVAVAALYREVNVSVSRHVFNPYARVNRLAAQVSDHIVGGYAAHIGICAVVFAQVAT
jgi:Ser-tRNA(Ala) deacylase AlaX